MRTIMITAPCSGSGKTIITMGIIRALKNKGLDIAPFKTGPDYIDASFLGKAGGKRCGNLDKHLQGEKGIFMALSLGNSDYCVIEGAMGYFDGIYNTYENSSYDISRTLGINSVLVYTPSGEMFTAIPKIKGISEFEDSNIKAVIFNNVTNYQYILLKQSLEKFSPLRVLGYIPKIEEFEIKSRHLGLLQSVEIEDLDEKIESIAKVVEENIDIKALLGLMIDIKIDENMKTQRRDIRVGIAMDKAFSFYYRENLYLLESICEVTYFSPLEDKSIPECDFLYFGGGYPEVFKNELSSNGSMLQSIKSFADKDGFIYAECGGFMYLTKAIDKSKMVGIFEGESFLTKSLQRFGYIDIEIKEDCLLGTKGDKITAHEFHKSTVTAEGECGKAFSITKTMGEKKWECGFQYKNVLGGYPHINFLGNYGALQNILEIVERSK